MTDKAALREIHAMMLEAEQEIVPADLKVQGWIYRDLPGRVTPEAWDLFLSIMGKGNFQILVMSEGRNQNEVDWKRGQFFISPKGVENLKAYAEKKKCVS